MCHLGKGDRRLTRGKQSAEKPAGVETEVGSSGVFESLKKILRKGLSHRKLGRKRRLSLYRSLQAAEISGHQNGVGIDCVIWTKLGLAIATLAFLKIAQEVHTTECPGNSITV